jgi:two-component system, OmpR family, response regulator
MDIFLVEDDKSVQSLLVEALESADFTVACASNGDEAATALMRLDSQPRLLLTDIDLGSGINGLTLGARARGRRPSMPVIYISGRPLNVATAGGSRMLHAFEERFLQKPFPLERLLCTVALLIN